MPVITLPDGSERNFDASISVHDVAADIGAGLANSLLSSIFGSELLRGRTL